LFVTNEGYIGYGIIRDSFEWDGRRVVIQRVFSSHNCWHSHTESEVSLYAEEAGDLKYLVFSGAQYDASNVSYCVDHVRAC